MTIRLDLYIYTYERIRDEGTKIKLHQRWNGFRPISSRVNLNIRE